MARPIIGSDATAIYDIDLAQAFERATGKKGKPEFVDDLDAPLPPETYQIYMDRRTLDSFVDFPFDVPVLRHVKDSRGQATQRDVMLALMERSIKEQDAHLSLFPRNGRRELTLMYHLSKALPQDLRAPENAAYLSRAIMNMVGKTINNHAISNQRGGEANTPLLEAYTNMVWLASMNASQAWLLYTAMLEGALRNGFDFLSNDYRQAARYVLGEGLEEREWPGIVKRAAEVIVPALTTEEPADLRYQIGKIPYSMVSGDNRHILNARASTGNRLVVPENDVADLLGIDGSRKQVATAMAARYGLSREDVLRLLLRSRQQDVDISMETPVLTEGGKFLGFEAWKLGEPIAGEEGIDILETAKQYGARLIPGLRRKHEPERTVEIKPTLYLAFDAEKLQWHPWSDGNEGLYDTYAAIALKLGNEALGKEFPVVVNGLPVNNRDQLELALVRKMARTAADAKAVQGVTNAYKNSAVVVMTQDVREYKGLVPGEGAVAIIYQPKIDHYDGKGRPVPHYTERRAIRQLSERDVAAIPVTGLADARGVTLKFITK